MLLHGYAKWLSPFQKSVVECLMMQLSNRPFIFISILDYKGGFWMGPLGVWVGITPDGWIGGREVEVMDACCLLRYEGEATLACPVIWVLVIDDLVDAQDVAVVGYI
jgi:hypothetical protein